MDDTIPGHIAVNARFLALTVLIACRVRYKIQRCWCSVGLSSYSTAIFKDLEK